MFMLRSRARASFGSANGWAAMDASTLSNTSCQISMLVRMHGPSDNVNRHPPALACARADNLTFLQHSLDRDLFMVIYAYGSAGTVTGMAMLGSVEK